MNRTKDFTVKALEAEARTLLIVGSTEDTDRDGDILMASGWKLDNYVKNPVVLWAHDYARPPIGTAKSVYLDKRTKQLCFKVYFPSVEELTTPGQPPSEHALFVDTVFNMYKSGLLNASSVGYTSAKGQPRMDQEGVPVWMRGLVFDDQELVELSCVPVPANANALVQARALNGISTKGLAIVEKEWERLKAAMAENEKSEDKGEEDMADKLSEEEVTKLKAFVASLPKKGQKANRKLSAASLANVNAAIESAQKAVDALKALVSDGVEETEEGSNDGVEDTKAKDPPLGEEKPGEEKPGEEKPVKKAFDLATMTVDQANNILRQKADKEGV
jgi:hypothetical protein